LCDGLILLDDQLNYLCKAVSKKAKLSFIALILVLPLGGIYGSRVINSRVLALKHAPEVATERSELENRYCIQRSPPDGIVIHVGSECGAGGGLEAQGTVGVVISSDGDSKVLTGFEL
jgi:hypothetical protein